MSQPYDGTEVQKYTSIFYQVAGFVELIFFCPSAPPSQIVEIDVPDDYDEEESPIIKVLWENPQGGDIEIPRGMNIATMVEAGMIPPVESGADGSPRENKEEGVGKETAPGIFDPAAVKGAKQRSTEVSELYAKVMANKAEAKAKSEAAVNVVSGKAHAVSPNGYGSDNGQEKSRGTQNGNSLVGGISESGGGEQRKAKPGVASNESSGKGGEKGEGNSGYDSITQYRGDGETQVGKDHRQSIRYAQNFSTTFVQSSSFVAVDLVDSCFCLICEKDEFSSIRGQSDGVLSPPVFLHLGSEVSFKMTCYNKSLSSADVHACCTGYI